MQIILGLQRGNVHFAINGYIFSRLWIYAHNRIFIWMRIQDRMQDNNAWRYHLWSHFWHRRSFIVDDAWSWILGPFITFEINNTDEITILFWRLKIRGGRGRQDEISLRRKVADRFCKVRKTPLCWSHVRTHHLLLIIYKFFI